MPNTIMKKTTALLLIVMIALQGGCVSSEKLQKNTETTVSEASKGTKTAPSRTVTNFTKAVRCMDGLFSNYGVRDISVLVEDLDDSTKKVSVGTRDMLLSTMSEMTRRSRAVKFISYGGDQKNIVSFMAAADMKKAYATVPQYDIRGSITQYDDNVVKSTKDVGAGIGDFLTLGKSASATAKILGLDLSIINTADLSLIPGVTSKNSVAIWSLGDGVDGEARYQKFGVNYSTSLSRNEGTAVAVRNLVELASVELMGKLTKVPYWQCMGSSAKDPDVKSEIDDWFEGMTNNTVELFAYFQYQLAIRGVYKGRVDGVPTPQFSSAIKEYKAAMGLPVNADLNSDFLAAYLDADHAAIAEKLESMKQPQASRKTKPIEIKITPVGASKPMFDRKEKINLTLSIGSAAYVYCYLLDESKSVIRFFPNRFTKSPYLDAGTQLKIPDSMKFDLVASDKAQEEKIMCFGTRNEVMPLLPESIRGIDFEPLRDVRSLDDIRAEFARINGEGLGVASFTIRVNPGGKK